MIPILIRFWKPLAGAALLLILMFAWNRYEASVEKRGYDKGKVIGIKEGTYSGYLLGHKAAVDKRKAQDAAAFEADRKEQDLKDAQLRAKQHQEAMQRQNERKRYEDTIAGLRADAGRGNSGMYAPGDGSCVPAGGEAQDRSAAGGPGGQAGHALLPETAQSVLDAASDLRQGVLDRNALIDAYNDLRQRCTAPP